MRDAFVVGFRIGDFSNGFCYDNATCKFFLKNLDKWENGDKMAAEVDAARGY